MRYPKPLRQGDTIGITATSSGVTGVFLKRIDNARKRIESLGFNTIETESVRKNNKLVSADPKTRAEEFMKLYRDKSVRAIIPPWGGQFLMEILPYLDYDEIKTLEPKWIMGFSDTSTLMFVLTTVCDIATVHGPNLTDFGSEPVHDSVVNALNILQNPNEFFQYNLDFFQKEWGNVDDNPFVPYQLTEKVQWKSLFNDNTVKFDGRLIGGCMDVICKLIGTPFDRVTDYIQSYKDDSIIWYFESCDMDTSDIYRTLWQMKLNKWFENCSGILIGRTEGKIDVGDFNLINALKAPLEELNIPVIYDVDIGHVPPQLTLINGVYAEVKYSKGEGTIYQTLR